MKIAKLFGKVLLALVLLYGIIGFFVLPGIVKDEVVKNAESILKRKVSLEDTSINPFSFSLTLETLLIHSKGTDQALAGAKKLEINVDPLDFIFGDIKVSHVKLSSPFLTLHKDKDGKFNFADLLESDANASEPSQTKTPLPNLIVEKFSIREGKVNFVDETGSKVFSETFSPINFTVRDFSTMQNHENQLSLHIKVGDGAYVDYRGKVNSVEPLRLEGELALHSGRLYTQWKYFQDSLGFIVADGSLDASMSYNADFSEDIVKIYINQYQVSIDKLRLQEKATKENILRLPSFRLEGSADLTEKEINIETFAVKDFSVKARRDKEGKINWLGYFPASKSEESNKSEESPWTISMANFDFGMKSSSFEEHYAPRAYISSFEELGLHMKDVKINSNELRIPTFDFSMSQIQMQELDKDSYSPFSLDRLAVHGRADLKNQEINITTLFIDGMHSKLTKDMKGALSYLAYIPNKDEVKTETKTEDSPMQWEVKSFILKNSGVDFSNKFDAVDGFTKIENIDLNMTNLSSVKGTWANSKLNMRINKIAKVQIDSKIRQSPLKIHSTFDMKNLDLVKMQAYMNKNANIDIKSGSMNLAFKAEYDEKQTKVIANMQMNNLNMSERKEGKTFFAFSKLVVKGIDLSLNPDQMKVNQVDIYKPYARMKVDVKKSTNLQDLMIQKEEVKVDTNKKPFSVFIGKVNFKDGKGEFSDLSLPLPFKTDVHEINGKMIALGTLSDIKTTIDIDGTVDEYGLMKINGSLLSATPKVFTDIDVKFQNIDMTNLSPYTGKFIGYKLREGKMNVELSYKINDSQMQGANRIILKKMNLGEEVESEEAMSAPVGLAIALLKDGDGVIDLDVPVSGDVDAPEFAVGHVVWMAFKNLITGVATAPFKFLGNMLGISAEELENISFEEGKSVLLPPQRETLDKLSEALQSKELLILKVAGSYDVKRDMLAMKTALIYEEALLKLDDKTTDISKMDREKLDTLLEEMYISHFTDERLSTLEDTIEAKEISSDEKTLALRDAIKKELIEDQKVSQADLVTLAKGRATSIVSYLIEKGIDATRLELLDSVSIEIDKQESEYIPTKLELGAR